MSAARPVSDRLLGIWSVLVLAFLFLPIVVILAFSFSSGRLLVSWEGFSLEPFTTIVTITGLSSDGRSAPPVASTSPIVAADVMRNSRTQSGVDSGALPNSRS